MAARALAIGVVTLLPELVQSVAQYGVVGRAFDNGLATLACWNPRDFARDRHRTVDDRPYGGGPGMVLKYQPVSEAVDAARAALPEGAPAYLLAAYGRRFDQAQAAQLAAADGFLLVAGRYEGVDERVAEAQELVPLSLGDFVMSGGELAAMAVVDAVVRLLPGALGHECSAVEETFAEGLADFPQYTRPEEVDGHRVPQVLLDGNHAEIARWRQREALGRTWRHRPDLLAGRRLSGRERELLGEYWDEHGQGAEEDRQARGEDRDDE